MSSLRKKFYLVVQAAVVVASTSSYNNVLADVPNKDIQASSTTSSTAPSGGTNSNNNNDKDQKTCENGNVGEDGTCSISELQKIKDDYTDDCGVWLAPSTLPGAGLGMFAGKNFAQGESFMPSGDPVIPIVDILMHQRGRTRFIFLWDEYTWNGNSLGTLCIYKCVYFLLFICWSAWAGNKKGYIILTHTCICVFFKGLVMKLSKNAMPVLRVRRLDFFVCARSALRRNLYQFLNSFSFI